VDLKRRIPAKCAFFHAGDERIPKTEDSVTERDEFEPSVPIVQSLDEPSNSPGYRGGLSGYETLMIARTE
jgi:hypothetical protein